MRLIKNRKGVLSFFLVVMATFLFAYAYFKLGGAIGPVTKLVGSNEFDLVQQYEKGEAVRMYIDLALQNNKWNALFLFEENGHFADCGQNGEFYYWKNRNSTCYPDSNSISKGLSNIFVRQMNPFLSNYKEFEIKNITIADVEFDLGSKKLITFPFKTLKISEKPRYEISLGSSIVYDYDFDYDVIERFIANLSSECKEKEDMNVIDGTQLTDYVSSFVNKYNQQRQANQPEILMCENATPIDSYLETYRLCAESLDKDCYCSINAINKSKLTSEQNSKIINWDNELQAGNKYLVKPGMTSQLQECRLNDRTFKFCADWNKTVIIDGRTEKIKTKFAVYIDDESAPAMPNVLIDSKVKKYKIEASVSPDVKEYRVYIGKTKLPIDRSHYVTIPRRKNIKDSIYFDRDPSQYNIEVVPADFDGNCRYKLGASTC
ncbi:hypothetical protein KY336_00785 [Candidatus Woesearchaeota archaeon]|nr:hypothetical protein [Candidatus Woesearchaeota archaeon]